MQKLMEAILNKFVVILMKILKYYDTEFNEKILFWIEKVLDINRGKLKTYNAFEQCARNSFFVNFMKVVFNLAKIYFDNMVTSQKNIKNMDI